MTIESCQSIPFFLIFSVCFVSSLIEEQSEFQESLRDPSHFRTTAGNPFECGIKMWAGCWICFPLILPTPNCSHRGQELLQTFEGSSPTRTHKLVEKNILNIEDEPYGHINCYNIIDSPMMQGWCKILGFIGNKYLGHDGIATLVIGQGMRPSSFACFIVMRAKMSLFHQLKSAWKRQIDQSLWA